MVKLSYLIAFAFVQTAVAWPAGPPDDSKCHSNGGWPYGPMAVSEAAAVDYGALTEHWYEDGVEKGNGQVVMDMIADNIQWWCFGPAGFTMNDYYSGKSGAQGVGTFFQRLSTELGADTPENFQIKNVEVHKNVVTVYGIEIRSITDFMRANAPGLKGETSYNYFTHRLEFDLNGRIAKFRCNWALSDTPAPISPF
jgi:hypothetical protein